MHRRLVVLSCVVCSTYLAAILIYKPSPTRAAQTLTEFYFLPQIANDFCGPFLDPFDDSTVGWFTGHIDGLQAELVDGEYRLAFSERGAIWFVTSPICPRNDYRAEVDVRWAGGTGNFIGLLFEVDEEAGRAYLFAVNTDARVWLVFEVDDNGLNYVISPTINDAILPGNATNRLAVARAGNRIVLTVNASPVGELTNVPSGVPSLAGVAAASYTNQSSADARFDNFFWSAE